MQKQKKEGGGVPHPLSPCPLSLPPLSLSLPIVTHCCHPARCCCCCFVDVVVMVVVVVRIQTVCVQAALGHL